MDPIKESSPIFALHPKNETLKNLTFDWISLIVSFFRSSQQRVKKNLKNLHKYKPCTPKLSPLISAPPPFPNQMLLRKRNSAASKSEIYLQVYNMRRKKFPETLIPHHKNATRNHLTIKKCSFWQHEKSVDTVPEHHSPETSSKQETSIA